MFDNSMTGAVGFAMHADRLATATRNLRLAEAEQARSGKRTRGNRVSREAIARRLIALATWVAPSVSIGTVATAQ